MGNCQAAEAATVVIQHPGGKLERIYWSVSANEVMNSNPGHYVAVIITSVSAKSDTGTPLKQLKLLRPDDTLHIGHVYRLISFEEVLKEFAAKKYTKLSKLLSMQKERGNRGVKREEASSGSTSKKPFSQSESSAQVEQEVYGMGSRRVVSKHGQWRPALQSIAEVGS